MRLNPESETKGNIVVTGASGFVGRNLVPYLKGRGYRVIPVSLREPGWKTRIPESACAIIHLAGLAHDMKNRFKLEDYLRVNVGLTREVFETFVNSGAEKFVLMSSVKAVADSPGEDIVTEEREPAPVTPYGRSKLEAERHVLATAAGREGVYVLRPCMIHGPGNRGNLNLLYRWIASGIPYPLGAFVNSRSFLSIENLNFVLGELLVRSCASGIYNVADSGALSSMEVVKLIAESRNRTARCWHVPAARLRLAAQFADALHLPFGLDHLVKLTESYRVDNCKILGVLGSELPCSSREGLRRTLESFTVARS